MAYRPHMLITALGRLGNPGSEIFSYSLRMAPPGDGSVLQQLLDIAPDNSAYADMAEDVRAFHARATTGINASAVLERVKFAKIVPPGAGHPLGKDGKPTPGVYAQDPVVIDVTDTPGAFNNVDPNRRLLGPSSALAVSLTTTRRGPRGRGRFFIPMPTFEQDPANGFKISVTDAEGVRTSVVQLLNDLNNQPGIDVWNGVVSVESTFGYGTPVVGVRVGRVVDVVRSRRGKLSESYTATATVTPG